jgi:hypothetical protein
MMYQNKPLFIYTLYYQVHCLHAVPCTLNHLVFFFGHFKFLSSFYFVFLISSRVSLESIAVDRRGSSIYGFRDVCRLVINDSEDLMNYFQTQLIARKIENKSENNAKLIMKTRQVFEISKFYADTRCLQEVM